MYAIVNKVLSDIGYIKPSDSTGTLSQEMRLVSKKSGEYKPVNRTRNAGQGSQSSGN